METGVSYLTQSRQILAPMPGDVDRTVSADTVGRLNAALKEFAFDASIVEQYAGPQVESIALRPAAGQRIKTLRTALPDIALRLGVPNIRLAPRFTDRKIVVEVPRAARSSVSLADVFFMDADTDVASQEPTEFSAALPWAVGVTATGERVIRDLATAPHVLISGATGSGKSAALESMLMSLMLTVHPRDLEIILIDPKRVDLAPLETMPHVRRRLVTSAVEAQTVLEQVKGLMTSRYAAFQAAGVSSLTEYLATGRHLPRVVVVIDELADLLTAPNGKAIEATLIGLAQMARAAGIHLVCATQRPSGAILSTQLRSQLPTRLAFAVASATDSRIALDEAGAEKLTGKGDGLLKWVGEAAVRLQGAFVTDEWRAWLIAKTQHDTLGNWVRPLTVLPDPLVHVQPTVKPQPTNEQLLRRAGWVAYYAKLLGPFGWIALLFL